MLLEKEKILVSLQLALPKKECAGVEKIFTLMLARKKKMPKMSPMRIMTLDSGRMVFRPGMRW
jgi:hypothetical protein